MNFLTPVYKARTGETAVWLGNVSFDKLVPGFSNLALLHQRVAPVAISSFAIGIDLDGARKPLARFYLIGGLEIHVAGEERCFVKIRIEQERALVHLDRFRKLSFGEGGFAFYHCLVHFLFR